MLTNTGRTGYWVRGRGAMGERGGRRVPRYGDAGLVGWMGLQHALAGGVSVVA